MIRRFAICSLKKKKELCSLRLCRFSYSLSFDGDVDVGMGFACHIALPESSR